MKIAIIASIWIPVPPPGFGFGAQEYLAYELAEGLVRRGHEVTLFAANGSHTSAHLIKTVEKPASQITPQDVPLKGFYELVNLSEAYKRASDFDIIHNELLPYGLYFPALTTTPTIHTLHHQIHKDRSEYQLYLRYRDQSFVSISDAQRRIVPELNYVATVYNGIDPTFYQPGAISQKQDYLLYLGRMRKYKGIHEAIRIAKELDVPLTIASPLPNPGQPDYNESMEYWDTQIKPHLDSKRVHLGEIEGEAKVKLLQEAKALIFPVEREEPFGMTIVEAMACGTPAIAYTRGAMPELIEDGKTGFLVNAAESSKPVLTQTLAQNAEGMLQACKTLYSLSERDYQTMCEAARKAVEHHFSVEKMVDGYEKAYKKLLG
jgi:glycosyltransferase involved in cell wall biosynthesis